MPLSSTSRPGIRGRVIPRVPATLQATGGLAVSKENGIWTFEPDWSVLALETTLPDGAASQVWVYNSTSDTYVRMTLQAVIDEVTAGTQGDPGEQGEPGPSPGFRQLFDSSTTDADPGAGDFRLNNTTTASATAAYFDNADTEGGSVTTIIDKFDDSTSTTKGELRIEKEGDPSIWAEFSVTGSVVDGTGYRKVTLTGGSSNGTFTASDAFRITFIPKGDVGTAGAGTGDMLGANNLSDVVSISDSITNLGLGTASSPQFAGVNVGHASDTTLTRASAGNLAVEGNALYRAGGTDVPLADGGTGASLADPGADRIFFWDDSAGVVDWLTVGTGLSITGTTLAATGGAGGDVVDDLTPQLGGTLDANGFSIGFDDNTGITDDSGNEQLIFQKTASAVNQLEITNAATGNAPSLGAAGGDTNIDINLLPKALGVIKVSGKTVIRYPTDANFANSSLFLGDGGASLSWTAGLEGRYNTGVGFRSLTSITTGSYNTAVGFEVLEDLTTGANNTGVGEAAGIYNIDGDGNTLIGWKAGLGTDTIGLGDYNTYVGYACGWSTSVAETNTQNTAVGAFSLTDPGFIGDYNTCVGYTAGYTITNGEKNVIIGWNSTPGITTGDSNTIIGSDITGLSASLSDTIIIKGGLSQVRFPKATVGGVTCLAASAVAVTHTGNTTETTLATIAIPANSMGANGIIRVTVQWGKTGTAGTWATRMKFGGTLYSEFATLTANFPSAREQIQIANRNATNSQIGAATGQGNFTQNVAAVTTSAVDTTASVNLLITGQLANGGDTIRLEAYLVELIVPPTGSG